ncbi:MAG: bifunctional diaminohydroxyphosphoribosylaminopyrimidine deaminase/5-amino-6-(5-phosphoribosylamino)uracil reductase RibD [Acidaminobacteraceae bacterium]
MDFMKEAYELARKGLYTSYPNPMVGALIVHNTKVIGRGYHEEYGENHAEKNAIEDAYDNGYGNLIKESTMYVTLEPCNHYGKTPPCVELIIKEKIKAVHISQLDVNPLMQGKSVQILRDNNISVTTGDMSEHGRELNSKFINRFEGDRAYVTLKTATTLDGKIASKNYDSKWITCDDSRKRVHVLRKNNEAILTSYKTANIDNAKLNIRHVESKKNPIPVIIDRDLKTNRNLDLFDLHNKVLIITSKKNINSKNKIKFDCENNKANVVYIHVEFKSDKKKLDLEEALIKLRNHDIFSVLVEAGGGVAWELLKENLVDEYYAFIASKIIGGRDSISSVAGQGFDRISDSFKLKFTDVEVIGTDILIRGKCLCSQG